MARIALLGMLLAGAAIVFISVNSSATEVQNGPMTNWDMRQEIQDASDNERNPWRREMDI